jgi:hypothetical protein
MAREANLEFSIDQSHTPTKMEIPIGNGNLMPRFFSNGSISPNSFPSPRKILSRDSKEKIHTIT